MLHRLLHKLHAPQMQESALLRRDAVCVEAPHGPAQDLSPFTRQTGKASADIPSRARFTTSHLRPLGDAERRPATNQGERLIGDGRMHLERGLWCPGTRRDLGAMLKK